MEIELYDIKILLLIFILGRIVYSTLFINNIIKNKLFINNNPKSKSIYTFNMYLPKDSRDSFEFIGEGFSYFPVIVYTIFISILMVLDDSKIYYIGIFIIATINLYIIIKNMIKKKLYYYTIYVSTKFESIIIPLNINLVENCKQLSDIIKENDDNVDIRISKYYYNTSSSYIYNEVLDYISDNISSYVITIIMVLFWILYIGG